MTFYANVPDELAIVSTLQAWVMTVLPLDLNHVIQANDNSVPQPSDPFIAMTPLRRTPLSTPWLTYTDTDNVNTESETTNLSIEYEYQLDCYGPQAADYIMVLHVLLRSEATSEWFTTYGAANGLTIDTFYTSDPTHTPITNEENQYEERWTLRLTLNVVLAISTPINFMSTATISPLVNVSTLPR